MEAPMLRAMCPVAENRRSRVKSRGFTLVELWIAVSVVVVLTAVGIPVISSMKSRADQDRCRDRLRSWGIAIGSYAADHDNKVHWEHWHPISHNPKKRSPYVPYWTAGTATDESLDLHLKQRCCPAVSWNPETGGNAPVSYAMIQPSGVSKVGLSAWMNDQKSSDYALSRVTRPADFMLMIDATGEGSTVSSASDFDAKVRPLMENGKPPRHGHTVNALMADFSIRTMTWKEIEDGLDRWTTF